MSDDNDPTDIGRDATTAPRLRARPTGRPTRWEFVEVEDVRPTAPADLARICASCGEPASVLHHATTTSSVRTVCGKCEGKRNRDRIGWATAADPTEPKRGRS